MNVVDRTNTYSADERGHRLDPDQPITAFARDSDRPYRITRHWHRRAQLVYASRGVITVTADQGTWVVPPQQAVWLPPAVPHEVASPGPLALRSIYIDPSRVATLPQTCCVVEVRPLLRELILEVMHLPDRYPPDGREARLAAVLLDELEHLQPVPLHLPSPTDRRLTTIAAALLADPADNHTLAFWAQHTGASERTLARLFVRETGLSFGEWRIRLRVISAIERLAAGRSVTEVAYDLGYASPSAFVARFRQTVGVPPGQYLRSG